METKTQVRFAGKAEQSKVSGTQRPDRQGPVSWHDAAKASVNPEDLHAALAVMWVAAVAIGASLLGILFYLFGVWGPISCFGTVVAMFLVAGREK